MDIRRDRLRRQLDEEQRAAASLAGAPTRRQLLRIGGSVVLGSAVIAACTNPDKDEQLAQTGTLPPTTAGGTSTTVAPGRLAADAVTLLRVAQSIELLAIDVYRDLQTKSTNPAVADALGLFRQQHVEHNNRLSATIAELGGQPYTQPNPVLAETVQERRDSLETALEADPESAQQALLKLALDLEDIAAQTYAYDVGVFTVPELRVLAASIGGVEARHVAVLLGIRNDGQTLTQAPFPFTKSTLAVNEGEAVDVVGAGNTSGVTLPSTTTTRRAGTTSTTGATGGAGGNR